MTKLKIAVNTIIRNEERWVWFAVMSVINYVDEIMIWDTGSTDKTIEVIKNINNPKIKFKAIKVTENESDLSKARNQMLKETRADWLMILDGDEIWPDTSIQKAIEFIKSKGNSYDSIVVPTLNCIGDVFHISPPNAGQYKIAGRKGHYNLRFINLRRIPGLHVANLSNQLQSYYDRHGIKIQDRDPKNIAFINAPYLHMTHLLRSHSRKHDAGVFWRGSKYKTELGVSLSKDFKYPTCFNLPRPQIVISPWHRRNIIYVLNALWQTPLKLIKRRFRGGFVA